MCIRSHCKKVPGIHGIPKRYRGQSRERTGYNGASPTKDGQGDAKLEWQDSSIKQVHLTGDEQMPSLFSHIEEVV